MGTGALGSGHALEPHPVEAAPRVSVPDETAVPHKAPGFLLCELKHSGKRAASFLSNEVTP